MKTPYRRILDFPHPASPTKTNRIFGRSMSAKLGVPGDGVGSGAGVPPRDTNKSGLFETLCCRPGVTTRWQALETRRARPRPELTSCLRRDSTVFRCPSAELVFARL